MHNVLKYQGLSDFEHLPCPTGSVEQNKNNISDKIWLVIILSSFNSLSRRYGVGSIQLELETAKEVERGIFCGTM